MITVGQEYVSEGALVEVTWKSHRQMICLMTPLLDAIITRQRTVLTILAALILGGLYAIYSVPREADPDVPIPFILVSAPHPGISPEDAERLLIKPLGGQAAQR